MRQPRKRRTVQARRTSGDIKGVAMNPPASVEARYRAAMDKLVRQMNKETTAAIKEWKDSQAMDGTGMDAIPTSLGSVLDRLTKRFDAMFKKQADVMASVFVKGTDAASRAATRANLDAVGKSITLSSAEMTKGSLGDIFAKAVKTNADLIKSIPSEHMGKVREHIADSFTTGRGLADLLPQVRAVEGMTERRAKLIAYDQTRKVYATMNADRIQAVGAKRFEWLHSGGAAQPRPDHVAMSGNIYFFNDPPIIDKRTGERGFPGDAINCFIGSTKVSLANGCRNLWRYWHDGDIHILHLQCGEIITCTGNHPILTNRGWLPADKIKDGDYLISCKSDNVGGIDNESTDFITTFDDLFDSLSASCCVNSISGSEFNFHGDIPNCNVDAISASNNLLTGIEACHIKQFKQLNLTNSDVIGNSGIPCLNSKIVDFGSSCLLSDDNPLIFGEGSHPCSIGHASISKFNSVSCDYSSDKLPAAKVFISEAQNAFTADIAVADFIGHAVNVLDASNVRAEIIESDPKSFGQSASANTDSFTECFNGFAGINRGNRVVKKLVSIFSGHVYTMETNEGWYSITESKIISKNCGCRMLPVFDDDDE